MGASQSSPQSGQSLTSIEICAGAGGQAVGLHAAGFEHLALVELDGHAVDTLKWNVSRHGWPGWGEGRSDELKPTDVKSYVKSVPVAEFESGSLDLLAGGVPCPPFSFAGKRLGEDDERDLFPSMLDLVNILRPKAVMIENVRGILEPPHVFIEYRKRIIARLHEYGYHVPEVDENASVENQYESLGRIWRRLDACDFGVPQLRPRAILVAIHKDVAGYENFIWPRKKIGNKVTVLSALEKTMRARYKDFWDRKYLVDGQGMRTGKEVFELWADKARKAETGPTGGVAPTLVGGSKKHGGADLGPSRAKKAWGAMGVDATGVANDREDCDPKRDLFRRSGPMLTVEQAAIIQGFPVGWKFSGGKTARYRQVGNAFPPPVAEAVGRAIAAVLRPGKAKELLENYEMDSMGEPESFGVQTAIPFSSIMQSFTASDDGSRDPVGADR